MNKEKRSGRESEKENNIYTYQEGIHGTLKGGGIEKEVNETLVSDGDGGYSAKNMTSCHIAAETGIFSNTPYCNSLS